MTIDTNKVAEGTRVKRTSMLRIHWIVATVLAASGGFGCSSDEPTEVPESRLEVLLDEACEGNGKLASAHQVDGGFLLLCGRMVGDVPSTEIVHFDDQTGTRTLLFKGQSPNSLGVVIDNTVYTADGPRLYAMRIDAGPSTPVVIAIDDGGFNHLMATQAHLYWTGARRSQSDPVKFTVSRVQRSGGSVEPISDLPLFPMAAALVGDAIYVVGLPDGASPCTHAIVRTQISTRSTALIFAQPAGSPFCTNPWFASYRDHVLWVDRTAVPPKLFEIRGDNVVLGPELDPLPWNGAVLYGNQVATTFSSKNGFAGFAIVDLETKTSRIFDRRDADLDRPQLSTIVGVRGEFIFLLDRLAEDEDYKLLRLRTLPAQPRSTE
ncbi:MAG TPA: hypothetical protein VNO30_17130 [Kofleriaceae bacterium]|nr:hypothetical protein [Kofleriaceae bacterium]